MKHGITHAAHANEMPEKTIPTVMSFLKTTIASKAAAIHGTRKSSRRNQSLAKIVLFNAPPKLSQGSVIYYVF
jgi:hypothetical protein